MRCVLLVKDLLDALNLGIDVVHKDLFAPADALMAAPPPLPLLAIKEVVERTLFIRLSLQRGDTPSSAPCAPLASSATQS